jgi:beta-galactosidase
MLNYDKGLLNSGPEYINQFERMILRDRNHPSVFLWSIGNEEGWIQTTSNGKRIAQTLLQNKSIGSHTYQRLCAISEMYLSVNEIIPWGFNYRQFDVAAYHKDHPAQPMHRNEMGGTVTTRASMKIHPCLCSRRTSPHPGGQSRANLVGIGCRGSILDRWFCVDGI